ncbi:NACHT domain-containing protein [Saccharopolyspora antimicrobica]|uniref:NACHT domain-containing protein n=1 Tax=Saccharopolyspora antimicrobica TaxID=455193 RepID=A0A1I5EZS6_9PSEU|nr:NACHT domain-containing protein [Saccharopolyspora antimicrobica]SFO16923.1 NACHT domain-containing protein [Saccharopolyspora antimicrobica]
MAEIIRTGAHVTSEFGPLLRQLRKQAGMTQERLAERSELAVRTIRRLETGAGNDPRVGTVKLLAQALDLSPDDRQRLMAAASSTPLPVEEPAAEAPAERPAEAPPERRTAAQRTLDEAAEQLAQVVAARWQREEEHRRVHDPFQLPVRFRAGESTGGLGEIVDVYRRTPSGRLVVLGRPGSGKTILALRFVLDHLRTRRDADPVPVIFSVGSWDPTATALRDWLIDQLLRDYPGLVATAPDGSTLAAALVETGRVLPVLDGFDEISNALHRAALEALNATTLPLLLTSRPGEYGRAVEATALARAAEIELVDLTRADLTDYLGTAWAPVLDELRDRPESRAAANITAALTTPLMVVLARTVYRDANPADLLDTARFPTPGAVEAHLLGSFVPTLYRPGPPQQSTSGRPRRSWDPALVQRWLGHLAHHLDRRGTTDIAWWQLGSTVRRSTRILAVVVASTVITSLLDLTLSLPAYLQHLGFAGGIGAAVLEASLIGLAIGLAIGLVHGMAIVYGGVEFRPARMQVRLRGRGAGRKTSRSYVRRFGAGMVGGFVVGIGVSSTNTLVRGLLHGFPPAGAAIGVTLVDAFLFGLIFGLSAALVLMLAAVLEKPLDIDSAADPVAMLAENRRTVLRQTLLLVPVLVLSIAFGGQLVTSLFQGTLGPLVWFPHGAFVGLLGGISVTLAYSLAFTAWGQWILLARLWSPLTGRLPWATMEFLADAYERGVLRQSGAVYQFRHARLQEHLSSARRSESGIRRRAL